MTAASALAYALEIDGVDPEAFRVEAFEAREALSDGSRAWVDALGPEPVDPDTLIGKTAVLRVRSEDGDERLFRGVVAEAHAEVPRGDACWLTVEIAARIELLRLGRDTRMFQQKSVRDVVTEVMTKAGIPDADLDWQLRADYPAREYVVQNGESDYDFCARLLAEEGIAFAVRHDEDADRVLFFDDPGVPEPIPGNATLHDRATTRLTEDTVVDVRETFAVTADEAMLRDYDLRRPSFDLSASDKAEGSRGREVYEHPGGLMEMNVARRLAKRAVERLRAGRAVHRGASDCPRLAPARTFEVASHPHADANGEHLVVAVVHRARVTPRADGTLDPYENEFVTVPKTTPWRPPLRAAVPPHGVEVAFVTVPSGEEIHPDAFGRVKVRFPWDRSGVTDDKSSTWLRVGQLALGGSMIIPRKDFEVIVDHEFGDVDRPFVAGHLYNGDHPVPYGLPGAATQSSIQTATTSGGPGANELRFEDSSGGEEIWLNASKDLTVSVEHDATWTVVNNQACTVGSNHTLRVTHDHAAQVGANRTLDVGASQSVNVAADYSDAVGGDETVSVGAVRKVQVGGDLVEESAAKLSRTVGSLQSVTAFKGYAREVVGNSTTTVGAAWCEIVAGSRSIEVGGARRESIGALHFIRAKQVSVSCGGGFTLACAAEANRIGGTRTDSAKAALAVTSGGGVSVKAKTITFEAKTRLVLIAGPCMITLGSSGSISIRAPTVDLTGTKKLGQIIHKTQ